MCPHGTVATDRGALRHTTQEDYAAVAEFGDAGRGLSRSVASYDMLGWSPIYLANGPPVATLPLAPAVDPDLAAAPCTAPSPAVALAPAAVLT